MYDGGFVSRTGILACALWILVLALLALAWYVALFHPQEWATARMLAASGCALAPLAAVIHIKTYLQRQARLIRTCNGLPNSQPVHPELRSLP